MTADATTARPPLAERALAQRVRAVPPSGIRRFFDILATMDDVISLGVGEPDFDTPREIVEAGVESLREGRTHYTSNFGTIELRRALAEHLRHRYGVTYDPATEILITVGASEAVDLALRATCDPGDEVILHEPSYVAYVPAIVFAGGTVVPVATRFEDDFALDPKAVEAAITPRTKALFLGYPANPTGAVLDDDVQDELARIAARPRPARLQRRDLRPPRVRDLPASRVQLAARHARADDPDGRLLQGLRDDRLARGLGVRPGADPRGHRQGPPVRDHVRTRRSPRTRPWSRSGTARPPWRPWSRSTTAAARLLVDGLNRLGLPTFEPRGAFYAFPEITSTGLTSDEFTEQLLREEQVAAVPGERVRAVGRGSRPHVLRDRVREDSRRRSCGSAASWSVRARAPDRGRVARPSRVPAGAGRPAPT